MLISSLWEKAVTFPVILWLHSNGKVPASNLFWATTLKYAMQKGQW